MNDKRKNSGLATVEIIIAAVILAVVIIGVVVVIKMVSGGKDDDTKQTASQQLTSIFDVISTNLEKADLDILYATNNNDVSLRLIGRDGFQIFQYNSKTMCLYFQNMTYATATTDEEKVKAARNTTLDVNGATRLNAEGSQVKVFLVQVPNSWNNDSRLEVSVRVEDDNDSEILNRSLALNADLIALKNGSYKAPTPTEDPEQPEDPTPTPTPKPADPTPTPDAGDGKQSEFLGFGQKRIDLTKLQGYLESFGEDAELVVTIKFGTGSAKSGWGVGGLAIGSDSCVGDIFEYTVDHDPEPGEKIDVVYSLKQVINETVKREATAVAINFYNGFSIDEINIKY